MANIPQINNLTDEEKKIFYSLLKASNQKDSIDLNPILSFYELDYEEVPVNVIEFITNENYMGKVYDNGNGVYPYWKSLLQNFFHNNPNKAFELMITGAIGIGKTTIASIALTYVLYRTMCLKDPQKFYGLTSNSIIAFLVMNLTLDLAYDGLYTMIVEAIKLSPWFMQRVTIRGKYEYVIEFPKNIVLMAGSQTTHTIGKNILVAILDEVNFSKAPKGSKNSVMDMYRNIRRRLESRFLKQGRIPGLLMMISSKNDELDFLEQYIQSVKYQPTTWVVDKPIYEIKPPDTYKGDTFNVAVGDKTKESKILTDTDNIDLYIENGYRIISVPTEYYVAFKSDINEALKDIAGISSVSTNKLIPYVGKIEACIDTKAKSPFMVDTIQLSLESIEDIIDYLDDIRILKKDIHKPRFAHIDIGLKGDKLGLAVVHEEAEVAVDRYEIVTGKKSTVLDRKYVVDILLSIQAVSGSEIPLYKVREFIMWLKDVIGYKMELVTYDGFQSADSIQLLKMSRINAALLSVDRTAIPYLNLRSCILENRLTMYHNTLLVRELRDLEYSRKDNKVDHPALSENNSEGSKDLSDALCGAINNAQDYYTKNLRQSPSTKRNVNAAIENIRAINAKRELAKYRNTITHDNDWIL